MAFEKLMAFLGLDAKQFRDELKRAEKEAAATGKGFERVLGEGAMKRIADSWQRPITTIGSSIMSFFAYDQIKGLVQETIQWGKEIAKTSEDAGISTYFLQGLASAARKVSADTEAAVVGIGKLHLKLSEAQNGSEEATKSFQKWGIDIKGRSTEEVYLQMVKLRNASNENAMFFNLMGKNYKDALGIARLGLDGLNSAMEKSSKLTDEEIAKLRELSTHTTGVWKEIKIATAKVITWRQPTPTPVGVTEETVRQKMESLAKERGINLKELENENSVEDPYYVPSKKNASTRDEIRKAALKQLTEEKKAADEQAARDTEMARVNEYVAKLTSETDEIYRNGALAAMTSEEKLAHFAQERLKLEQKISKERDPERYAELSKQRAEIEVQEDAAKKSANKSGQFKPQAPDLNALQKIGAYTSQKNERDAGQQKQIQIAEKTFSVLERIERTMKSGARPTFTIGGETQF